MIDFFFLFLAFYFTAYSLYGGTAIAVALFGFFNLHFLLEVIFAFPLLSFFLFFLYLLIGFAWSIYKWKKYVSKMLDVVAKASLDDNDLKRRYMDICKPHVSESKFFITGWILFWPFSILVAMSRFKKVVSFSSSFFCDSYKRIVDSAFGS